MGLGLRTMEQRIDAGGNFDGTVPSGPIVRKDSIEAYPSSVAGGLFDLELKEPVFVRTVELKLGGQSLWTVHKRDREGAQILVSCGTNEPSSYNATFVSFAISAARKSTGSGPAFRPNGGDSSVP